MRIPNAPAMTSMDAIPFHEGQSRSRTDPRPVQAENQKSRSLRILPLRLAIRQPLPLLGPIVSRSSHDIWHATHSRRPDLRQGLVLADILRPLGPARSERHRPAPHGGHVPTAIHTGARVVHLTRGVPRTRRRRRRHRRALVLHLWAGGLHLRRLHLVRLHLSGLSGSLHVRLGGVVGCYLLLHGYLRLGGHCVGVGGIGAVLDARGSHVIACRAWRWGVLEEFGQMFLQDTDHALSREGLG